MAGVGKSFVFCDSDTNTMTIVNSMCMNEIGAALYLEPDLGGLNSVL